jgi:hypothetical protein
MSQSSQSSSSSFIHIEDEIDKKIFEFFRFRESNCFEREMTIRYKNGKRLPTLKNKIDLYLFNVKSNSTETNLSDVEVNSSDDDSDNCVDMSDHELKSKNELVHPVWLSLWSHIVSKLKDLMDENLSKYFEKYSAILEYHIENRIFLDTKCFGVLTSCIRPALINDIFDKNLIRSRDLGHMNCMMENHSIFYALITPQNFTASSQEPFLVLLCLTVLIYKTKCTSSKKQLIDLMNKQLAVVINKNKFHENFKKYAVNNFMRACYLNNFFDFDSLQKFLNSTQKTFSNQVNVHIDEDDMDESNSEMGSDSDDDEMDEDDDGSDADENNNFRRGLLMRHRHININNFNNQNQPVQNPLRTVAENIGLNLAENKEFQFPLSLRNLCRIKIKDYLIDYTPKSVERLTILPFTLKRFILFRDEIEHLIKLSNFKPNQVQPLTVAV